MMFRSCASSLLSALSQPHAATAKKLFSHPGAVAIATTRGTNGSHLLAGSATIRSLHSSPVLCYNTKKRRKKYPFFWLQDKYRAYYDENLTPENEQFFQSFLKEKYSLTNGSSPLKKEPWKIDDQTYTPETQRIGLLARKLGKFPIWTKTGRMQMTTCLQVSDNHVIKYHSPEEYAQIGRPICRKRFEGLGCAIVGSDSRDPRQFTAEYNGLFNESGVMPKKKLTRFFVTHNARLEPGTPLLASHFRPGMFVDIYGVSNWHGMVNLRARFRLKLGQKTHGTTKSHNRIGSIGRGRKFAGPLKGKRMPGPKGHERTIVPGLKVWRINTKYNLIFVQGPGIPGAVGAYVNVMDSRMPKKTLQELNVTPPFPTATVEENSKLDVELLDKDMHSPDEPTIVMEVSEEEKRAAALAARKFGKAKTAQKSR